MIDYNSKNLIVGQIKQLIGSFNLPNIPVYNKKLFEYIEAHRSELGELLDALDGSYWIKDHYIQMYLKSDPNPNPESITNKIKRDIERDRKNKNYKAGFNVIKYFVYNQELLNYTKTYSNSSNIYDTNTHVYLGNYLRFQRDFNNLNLMSLYNCFNNELAKDLSFSFTVAIPNSEERDTVVFNSKDPRYKIYMIPVKYFQKYTIAIDSDLPVEMVCGFYDKTQVKDGVPNSYIKDSYLKLKYSVYSKPILYNKLFGLVNEKGKEIIKTPQNFRDLVLNMEDSLKLFIKIPKANNSTITILEGDYTSYNNRSLETTYNLSRNNRTIINYENREDFSDLNLISHNQLLFINSNKSHPFADRLIEYLVKNTIDNTDNIADNIRRLQTVLRERYLVVDKTESGVDFRPQLGLPIYKNYGIWEDKYRAIIYDIATTNNLLKEKNKEDKEIIRTQNSSLINLKDDILGYVDKDLEKEIVAVVKDENGNIIKTTTLDVDIYGKEE